MKRLAVVSAALIIAIPTVSRGQAEPPTSRKSETTATLLGIVVPGAGHIYAGEPGRGALFLVGTGLAFMYGFSDGRCKRPFTDVRTCELEKSETLATASFIAAAGIYAFSVWDAHRAARRTNARRGLAIGPFDASPHLSASAGAYPRMGVRLARSNTANRMGTTDRTARGTR